QTLMCLLRIADRFNIPSLASKGGIEDNIADNSNVIKIRVENVKDMASERIIDGEMKRINGFPWHAGVRYGGKSLYFRIECNKSMEYPFWACNVDGKCKLINRKNYTASICQVLFRPLFLTSQYD
ncbi:hypothetical protein PENTCL1PPCAC_23609, partial [Pristionchus entomophagus]